MRMSLTALARIQSTHSRLPESPHSTTFSSLRTRNFRLFATGQLCSNIGTWVQRIAQDWLVLSLTGSATDVGITTALQFVPTLLFGLVGGLIADRYPKRRILLATQSGLAAIAGILAVLTLTHEVTAWQVYLVAFGLGLVTAVDNPTRQSFANEMVGPHQLSNAISINSSVFQLGGLVGPAVSGALITAVGPGYSFAINALSYAAPLVALSRMRTSELHTRPGNLLRTPAPDRRVHAAPADHDELHRADGRARRDPRPGHGCIPARLYRLRGTRRPAARARRPAPRTAYRDAARRCRARDRDGADRSKARPRPHAVSRRTRDPLPRGAASLPRESTGRVRD